MINREFNLGNLGTFGEIRVSIKVHEGISILKTSNPLITKQMTKFAQENGKKVFFERNSFMIEKFTCSEEEQILKIDKDIITAYSEKLKAEKKRAC